MRISDWSSDVCSSDLREGFAEQRAVAMRVGDRIGIAAAGENAGDSGLGEGIGDGPAPFAAAQVDVEDRGVDLALGDLRQRRGDRTIGRASCRESVCLYV